MYTKEWISWQLVSLIEAGQMKMTRHSDGITCLDFSGSQLKKTTKCNIVQRVVNIMSQQPCSVLSKYLVHFALLRSWLVTAQFVNPVEMKWM